MHTEAERVREGTKQIIAYSANLSMMGSEDVKNSACVDAR